jgi:hypothetical protein
MRQRPDQRALSAATGGRPRTATGIRSCLLGIVAASEQTSGGGVGDRSGVWVLPVRPAEPSVLGHRSLLAGLVHNDAFLPIRYALPGDGLRVERTDLAKAEIVAPRIDDVERTLAPWASDHFAGRLAVDCIRRENTELFSPRVWASTGPSSR